MEVGNLNAEILSTKLDLEDLKSRLADLMDEKAKTLCPYKAGQVISDGRPEFDYRVVGVVGCDNPPYWKLKVQYHNDKERKPWVTNCVVGASHQIIR